MNYYKLHNIKPNELRDKFVKTLADTATSPWHAAQAMKITYVSMNRFLEEPEVLRYKAVAAIHNWINNMERINRENQGQSSL